MSRIALYHGTRRGFTRGGLVLPRSQHGGPGTTAPLTPGAQQPADAADWVYATTSLDLAWAYAWHAPGRGAPKVLEVLPHGRVLTDAEHSADMAAWRCEWATVARVLREPTVTEEEARAGWVLAPAPR